MPPDVLFLPLFLCQNPPCPLDQCVQRDAHQLSLCAEICTETAPSCLKRLPHSPNSHGCVALCLLPDSGEDRSEGVVHGAVGERGEQQARSRETAALTSTTEVFPEPGPAVM